MVWSDEAGRPERECVMKRDWLGVCLAVGFGILALVSGVAVDLSYPGLGAALCSPLIVLACWATKLSWDDVDG